MIRAIERRLLRLQDFRDRDHRAKAKHQYEQFETMLKALARWSGPIRGKKILDIGCGRFCPFTLLFHSMGNQATGIDTLYIGTNEPWLRRYWRVLRRNGLESLAEELLLMPKYKTYYKAMREAASFPLITQGIVLAQINAENMSFADETFDIVISMEVFEHLSNVAQAVSELSRVMKRGAFAYIDINLFTSISGGHHFNWRNPDKVPPWDHLRQRRLPFTVYLNEMREHEYIKLFREKLEVLEVLDADIGEGGELLIPEIHAELSNYSEEELLKYGIVIIARKG